MKMIRHSPGGQQSRLLRPQNATHVLVQAGFEVGINPWLSTFRGEHEVNIERAERLRHGLVSVEKGGVGLASLSSRWDLYVLYCFSPGVGTPGYARSSRWD